MGKRLFKKAVATIALTAMLLQTGYQDLSMIQSVKAAEVDNGIEVIPLQDDNTIEVIQPEESYNAEDEDIQISVIEDSESEEYDSADSEVYDDSEESTSTVDDYEDVSDDVIEELPDDTVEGAIDDDSEYSQIYEESMEAFDDKIIVTGYEDVTLHVVTGQMNVEDTFYVDITGPKDVVYNKVLDGRMEKSDQNTYRIDGIGKGKIIIEADIADDMECEYSILENGDPQIELISAEAPAPEKTIDVHETYVSGSGYDEITIKLDTNQIDDDIYFAAIVEADETASCDGETISDNIIPSLSNRTNSITISDLNKNYFMVKFVGETAEDVIADYSIVSDENGTIEAVIYEGEKDEESFKRVYVYEDDKVAVTATLDFPDAIPDDADFIVTEMTSSSEYNYDAYMQALNDNADAIIRNADEEDIVKFSSANTLLYDIAFYVYDEDGNYVEIQPEEGTVKIDLKFKKGQLRGSANPDEDVDINIIHMPLVDSVKENVASTAEAGDISADDIKIEVVNGTGDVDSERVSFRLSDFSGVAINEDGHYTAITPGKNETFETILGSAVHYGIVANDVTLAGHMESNMAVGALHGSAGINSCKNNGGSAGTTFIGAYDGTGFTMDPNGNSSSVYIYTTEQAYRNMGTNMTNGRDKVVVNTSKYTEGQIKSLVNSMVVAAQKKSAEIANEAAVNGFDFDKVADAPYTGNAQDKYLLDLSAVGTSETGTYYINFAGGRYAKVGHIYIKMNEGQRVVFNIPDNVVGFRQYTIKIGDKEFTTQGDAAEDIVSQNVIFNCPNALTAYTAGPVDGVFMVPYATDFSTKSVAGGWVVADTITSIGSQEWHCLWHDMPNPNPCEVAITAIKTVNNGTPMADEKFTFKLESYDWNTKQYTVIDEAVNNGESIMFKPIEFEKAGTYAFRVSEAAIDPNTGYIYDKNNYVICYDVVENTDTKQLSASIRWLKRNNVDWLNKSYSEIKFNNTVKTTPCEYEFLVKKVFEDDNWPEGTTYTFKIEQYDGDVNNWVYKGETHMPEKTQVTVTDGSPIGSFGKVYFEPDSVNGINADKKQFPNGTKAKAFMYKITEVKGSADGVTYDETVRYIKLWVNTLEAYGRKVAVVDDKLSIDNTSCVANEKKPIEFTNKYVATADISLLKVDGTSNKALSGVEFGLYDASNDNAVKISGKAGAYTVDANSTTVRMQTGSDGRITVSGLLMGEYYFKELTTPAGYKPQTDAVFSFAVDKNGNITNKTTANASLFTFSPAAGSSKAVYTVKNTRLDNGELYIKKLDSVTNEPIGGVVFNLYRNGSTTVYRTLTTNSAGEASVKDLEWGSYVLKEDNVEGYVANTTEYKFTIDATNRSKSFTGSEAIVNTPISGSFKLVKKADGSALAGAVFSIKFKNGNKITTVDNGSGSYTYSTSGTVSQFVTNASGEVNVDNLPYGDYEVVELSSPVGYVTTSTAANFSIKSNGATASAEVDNDKVQAAAQFIKLDATDESKLAGVVFELYDDANPKTVKTTATSDANGSVKFEGLGVGSYTIKEQVPSDYVDGGLAIKFTVTNDDNKQTIYLNKDGRVNSLDDAKIDNTRKSGSAKLLKKSDKGVVLSGVQFNLYTEAGKLVKVTGSASPYTYNGTAVVDSNLIHTPMVTGADGVIEVTGLPWGKYYFEEVSVGTSNPSIKPVDSSNSATYAVEIKAGKLTDTTHFDTPIVNDTIKGYVKLIKVDKDDESNKLEGVTFTLYKSDKTTKVADNLVLTTNGSGEIVYGPLEYGTYYFQEIATIDGYKYSDAFLEVVVNEESTASTVKTAATVTAENERELGSIKLTKKDSATGSPIAGAKFILQSTNNSGIVKAIQSLLSKDGYVQYGNATYTTDSNGIIFVDNLPWGMYRFKEVEAPVGYSLPEGNAIYSDEKYIGVNNKTATLHAVVTDMENDQVRGKVKLVKSASDNSSKKLSGGVFTIYDANGIYNNGQEYSLTDGEIVIDNLPFGSYYFYEVEAPEGYVLPSTEAARKSTVAVINAENAEASVKAPIVANLSNDIITGGFELHKVDATAAKNPLAGATFKLFDANGKVVQITGSAGTYAYAASKSSSTVEIMDTTAGGVLNVTGLPYGEYAIQEITAPQGYQVKSGTVGISITTNGETVEFDFENSLIQARATFTKADFDTKAALDGATFALYKETTSVDENGKTVTTATSLGSVSSVKGVFTTSDLGAGRYYVQETAAPDGYLTKLDANGNAKKYYFTIDASVNGQTIGLESPDLKTNGVSYILNDKKKGTAKLLKVGSDAAHKDALEGAEFALYVKTNGKYSVYGGTYTSDENGYVVAENLPWGEYYFIETKAPTGYDLDTNKYNFVIDASKDNKSSATIEVILSETAVNTLILGQAQITKKGYTANGLKKDDIETLAGAEFGLFYDDGSETPVRVEGYASALVANDKGLVTTRKDLPVGKYFLMETKAPAGYKLDQTHYTFEVTNANYKSMITPETNANGVVYNERIKGDVVLFKYETVNNKKVGLSGAKFKLYMKQTIGSKEIKSAADDGLYVSDANGLVSATGLEWGEYYFVEEVAPTGFASNKTHINFVISATDLHIEKNASGEYRLSLENDRLEGSLKLVKTDSANGDKLAGAEFSLYKRVGDDVTLVGTYTTDAKGEISVSDLSWATYYFVETKAPEGYVTPTGDAAKTAEVTISASNATETLSVSMTNDMVYGNVKITKTDDATPTANKLAGAVFSLYRKETTVDAEGKSSVTKTKVNVTKTADGLYAYSTTASSVTMVTPNDGVIKVTGLPYGTYVFIEDSAPTGFVKTDEEFEVRVTANQDASAEPVAGAYKTCINSTLSAGAVLYKSYRVNASDSPIALAGATFELYRVEKDETGKAVESPVTTAVSDANGAVRFTNLGEGSYVVREIAAPNNAYVLSDAALTFTVSHDDDGRLFELNTPASPLINTAKKGNAKITKYYNEGSVTRVGTLAGVTFDLFKGTKNADGTITYDTTRTAFAVTGQDGVANFTGLAWGYYAIKENKTNLPNGIIGIPDADNMFEFEINEANCTSTQTFDAENDRQLGSLEIEKVDNNGNALTGGTTTFLLTGTDSNNSGYSKQFTVSTTGKATVNNLVWGSYSLVELEAETGYVKDGTTRTFTIDGNNLKQTYVGDNAIVNDRIKGSVKLVKVNSVTKNPITSGVKFSLFNITDNYQVLNADDEEGYFVTDANGYLEVSDLEYGEYRFTESATEGYETLADFTFKIETDGQVVDFTDRNHWIENTPKKGSVKLIKSITKTTTPIEGATFSLYRTSPLTNTEKLTAGNTGVYVCTASTDKNGEIIVNNLEWGTYYFIEQDKSGNDGAPLGFEAANTGRYTFEITAANSEKTISTTINAYNDKLKGSVELTKIDPTKVANSGKRYLEGAEFSLYKLDENGDGEDITSGLPEAKNDKSLLITNSEGKITVSNLEWGTYYFVEETAPEGYECEYDGTSKKHYEFTIDASNCNATTHLMETQEVEVSNDEVFGYISIQKRLITPTGDVDSSVTDISGVKFEILDSDKKVVVTDLITNANGVVSAGQIGKLRYGTYYISEVFVPKTLVDLGYVKNSGLVRVEITESNTEKEANENAAYIYKFDNSSILGAVKLKKTDSVTGRPIEGMVFDLYVGTSPNGTLVTQMTTDSDGFATVEGLVVGNYYVQENEDSANSLGYVYSDTVYSFEITKAHNRTVVKNEDGSETINWIYYDLGTITNAPEKGSITLEKWGVDSAGNRKKILLTPGSAARFELYKVNPSGDDTLIMDEDEIAALYNTTGVVTISELDWGSYYFVETAAPVGYVLPTAPNNRTNIVVVNGASIAKAAVLKATIDDDTIKIKISKVEIDGDDELPGATMQLFKADKVGNVVEGSSPIASWTSTAKPHMLEIGDGFEGLNPGITYVLRETIAPAGYALTKDIVFTVDSKGKVTTTARVDNPTSGISTIFVEDRPITLSIDKLALGTETTLVGAQLSLEKVMANGQDNVIVDSWTTTANPHVVDVTLTAGESYILRETKAPVGYYTADPVTIIIKADGGVDIINDKSATAVVTKTTTTVDNVSIITGNKLSMVDKPIKLVVSKSRLTGSVDANGNPLDYVRGAVLNMYKLDKDGKDITPAVYSWTSSGKDDEIPYGKLEVGATYVIREDATKLPAGYIVADPVRFTVKDYDPTDVTDKTGLVAQKVRVYDDLVQAKFSKRIFGDNSGNELVGATLSLYDSSNVKLATWTTDSKPFVVTSVKEASKLSKQEQEMYKNYNVIYDVALEVGKSYRLVEDEAPYGYSKAEDIVFTIGSDGLPTASGTSVSNGTVIMLDKIDEQLYTHLDGKKIWLLYCDEEGNVIPNMTYADVTIRLTQRLKDSDKATATTNIDLNGDGTGDQEFFIKIANGGQVKDGVTVSERAVTYKEGAKGTVEFTFGIESGKNILPKKDRNGNEYVYEVIEEGEGKYDPEINIASMNAVIKNIPIVDPFKISGVKKWRAPSDKINPEGIKINLYRDDDEEPFMTTTLNDKGEFEFNNLWEYNFGKGYKEDPATADGHKFVYRIEETGADGFVLEVDFNGVKQTVVPEPTTTSAGKKEVKVTLTNTIIQEYVRFSGKKTWANTTGNDNIPKIVIELRSGDPNGKSELVESYELPNTSSTYKFGYDGKKIPKYDEDGQVINYFIKEIVPEGYYEPVYTKTVNGNDVTVNILNTPTKLVVRKKDASNGAELAGAKLSVKDSKGNVVDSWTSDGKAHDIEGLVIGQKYTLVEDAAPSGYVIAKPVEFTVTGAKNPVQEVEMLDPKAIGEVTLTKTDSATKEALSGAEFELYTSSNARVSAVGSAGSYEYSATGTTTTFAVGRDGTLKISKLPYGEYYFKETKAPAGYEISTESHYFTLGSKSGTTGATASVTVENTKRTGSARLAKISGGDGSALAGATFELYSKTARTPGQAVGGTFFTSAYYLYGTYVTDSTGSISVTGLPWDDYYFIETIAPDGHVLNLDTNGDPLVYTFKVDGSTTAGTTIDVGFITNSTSGGGGGAVGGTTTGGGGGGGVAGVRRLKGSGVSGVLGVRSAPTSGVLGVRVGPTTGDTSTIALWLVLLLASISVITAILISVGRRRKNK